MDRNEIRLQLAMANPGKSTWELDELARWVEDAPESTKNQPPKWFLTTEMAHVADLLGEHKKISYTFRTTNFGDSTESGSYTHDHDLYELVRSIDAFYSSRS